MKLLKRPLIGLSSLLMLLPATAAVAASAPASSPRAATTAVQAPAYDVTIKITEHGIPHITSDTFEGMAYGAGWATTAAATCNLMDTLLTARGERSKYLGPDGRFSDGVGGNGSNLDWDALVTDVRDRQVVEKLLADPKAGPSDRAEAMVEAEAAGINAWLAENEITDPACADAEWIKPDVTATDIWYLCWLAQVIGSTTQLLPAITAATPPTGAKAQKAQKPSREELLSFLGKNSDFGSNATAVGRDATSTRRGMLLGNPHFPWLGRYRFTQMHLTVPGKMDVAGGALTGFPAINIGFNKDVAWSHTVSTGYRFTPYQYTTAGTPTSYRTENGVEELEKRVVEVQVKTDAGLETVTRTLYRTKQGYVLSAPTNYMPWTDTSFWAIRDANGEHLRTFDTFLSMNMATSARNLLKRQDRVGGMPWVNTTAADRAGDIVYADHSVVPNVTPAMYANCLTPVGKLLNAAAGLPGLDGTRASSSCKWGTDKDAQRPGIFGPKNMPETFRRDWVMNANDSYWAPNDKVRLTGFARIIGCENCQRTMRTKVVMAYVRDQLKKGKETPASLASHQYANRVYAAEVARKGGRLDQVCDATGLTEACQVLRDWDGRSDTTSNAGAAIFQEFVQIASARKLSIWTVPFNVSKPFTTPNTLSTSQSVVDAMAAAIALVAAKGLDKTYGDLHYSGDRGSAGWPVGGGLGDLSGDANAVSSATGDRVLDPVTRGSSYIQAIAFTGKKGISARTILTYSQYENPLSPWSDDQTQLFSEEKWVRVPWTDDQIEDQLVDTIHLVGQHR